MREFAPPEKPIFCALRKCTALLGRREKRKWRSLTQLVFCGLLVRWSMGPGSVPIDKSKLACALLTLRDLLSKCPFVGYAIDVGRRHATSRFLSKFRDESPKFRSARVIAQAGMLEHI